MPEEDSKIFNPKRTKAQRKYLRNNMTKSEIILWSELKGRNLLGCKFRRQHGIGDYIVDFYCPELMLAIEVDGESHYTPEGESHDLKRSQYLKNIGIHINPQIKTNLDGVTQKIISFIQRKK